MTSLERVTRAVAVRTNCPGGRVHSNSLPDGIFSPFRAGYRDVGTAKHSRRVADLCVLMADGLMTCSDSYVLENAALLHGFGKIGVPDEILLKPVALTEDELKVTQTHEEISIEIIRSTSVCERLTEIVRSHHAWFDGNPNEPQLPIGTGIPLGGQILAIADSFDAMTSDRVYREEITAEEAFTELRRCAGTQFDPHLVERFIAIVSRSARRDPGIDAMVDKQSALKLGCETERLARAIDNRDKETLLQLSASVQDTAEQCSSQAIIDFAAELHGSINSEEDDWLNTLELTIELIELCRQAQKIHLSTEASGHRASSISDTNPERLMQANRIAASQTVRPA